jgi:Ca2+-binding RTX toxin-like protein
MRLLAVLGIAACAALALPATASTGGEIVIRGAGSGSSLEVGVSGEHLVVHGYLAPGPQQGCRVTSPRIDAVCPLGGVGGVEIEMGPSGDFVEIVDKLPVPLTAHLGGGSDKMIGNGEPDTCYSEGARRNRCTLGSGDDVCVTGNDNSDCVLGAGDDYCSHGDGSDGCWGGPGDDTCRMGGGEDGCHGEAGSDRLYGGPGADQLYGGPGNDYCDGGPGIGKSHGCERGPGH